jgi:hypothetical protein
MPGALLVSTRGALKKEKEKRFSNKALKEEIQTAKK